MHKIGHRGVKGHAPENTLESFRKAIDMNVDGIELDVYLCQSGEVVVIHDDTIDRTTSEKGFVKDLTAAELERLGIPTLESVFDLADKKCFINVEIKSYDASDKVAELIERYVSEKGWNYDQIIVSSFDWNALQQVHFLNDNIRIGVLTNTDLDLAIAFAKFIKAYSVHPYYHLLNAENVKQMQDKNFKVYPWTINEPEDIIFVKALQVDGIITDFPDRL